MEQYEEFVQSVSSKYASHPSNSYVGPINSGQGFTSNLENMTQYIPANVSSTAHNYTFSESSTTGGAIASNYSEEGMKKLFEYKSNPESPKYVNEQKGIGG